MNAFVVSDKRVRLKPCIWSVLYVAHSDCFAKFTCNGWRNFPLYCIAGLLMCNELEGLSSCEFAYCRVWDWALRHETPALGLRLEMFDNSRMAYTTEWLHAFRYCMKTAKSRHQRCFAGNPAQDTHVANLSLLIAFIETTSLCVAICILYKASSARHSLAFD